MLFFGKKKQKSIESPTIPPPRKEDFNITDVVLTLWNGTKMDTTIKCSVDVSLTEMMKSIIRDGIFDEHCEKIIRVNEIQLKKDEESKESEVMN